MRKKAFCLTQLLAVVAISLTLFSKSLYAPGASPTLAENDSATLQETLTVITVPSYHSYYVHSKNGADGFAFQLVQQYAQANNLKLKLILANHADEVYQALEQGIADFALLNSPLSLSKQNTLPQTQSYMQVTTELIYRHGNGQPQTFEELSGKTIVIHDNEQFREKQLFIQQHYPEIQWQRSALSTKELLEQVNQGKIDYTLVDSHDYLQQRTRYTRTRIAFPVYYPESLRIAASTTTSAATINHLDQYIDDLKSNGSMQELIERFYGHSNDINPIGAITFFSRVDKRLPKYQALIKKVAAEYNMDWRLLAAIAYQESHWNPKATSPTGVRGMMMLTLNTAQKMGVSNRLDLEQSLRGGAKYFQYVMSMLPEEIQQPDRTWIALASYNVGIGHVYDAQEITDFFGGNSQRWADLKKYLPLLEKPEWHEFTRFGYARGNEPVGYVQNIRHFRDLLEWRFPIEHKESQINEQISAVQALDDYQQALAESAIDPTQKPVRLAALIE